MWISRNWVSTQFLTFMVRLGTVMEPLHVSPSCRVSKGFKNIYLLQVSVAICKIFILAHWFSCPTVNGEGMATHFGIIAWKMPWTEDPGGPGSMGVAKSWTRLSNLTFFLSHGILVPRSGTEPTSPALQGRF